MQLWPKEVRIRAGKDSFIQTDPSCPRPEEYGAFPENLLVTDVVLTIGV